MEFLVIKFNSDNWGFFFIICLFFFLLSFFAYKHLFLFLLFSFFLFLLFLFYWIFIHFSIHFFFFFQFSIPFIPRCSIVPRNGIDIACDRWGRRNGAPAEALEVRRIVYWARRGCAASECWIVRICCSLVLTERVRDQIIEPSKRWRSLWVWNRTRSPRPPDWQVHISPQIDGHEYDLIPLYPE